jgi:hypothetical protein
VRVERGAAPPRAAVVPPGSPSQSRSDDRGSPKKAAPTAHLDGVEDRSLRAVTWMGCNARKAS